MSKTKRKKLNPVKRVVGFSAPVYAPQGIKLYVRYIVDHGDLISDIQAVYSECVDFSDVATMEQQRQKYIESKLKVKHDLEYQIKSTGATRYNTEKTARKLLDQYTR